MKGGRREETCCQPDLEGEDVRLRGFAIVERKRRGGCILPQRRVSTCLQLPVDHHSYVLYISSTSRCVVVGNG